MSVSIFFFHFSNFLIFFNFFNIATCQILGVTCSIVSATWQGCWQKEEDEHLPPIRSFDDDDDLW